MSKTFLISDNHFIHEKIIGYCNRPFKNSKDMNHYMIQNHNSVVSKEDTVYFLGDFCFTHHMRDVESILKKMNGTKHLILGNHDKLYVFDYVEAGFQSVHTSFWLEDFLLIHDPAVSGVMRDMKVIHGHVHGLGLRLGKNTWNVSVEMNDYTPVNFEYIKENW